MGKKKKKIVSSYWKYPAVQEYQKQYNKTYYHANREQIIAEQTRRNKENLEQLRRYHKEYYENNKHRYKKKRRWMIFYLYWIFKEIVNW